MTTKICSTCRAEKELNEDNFHKGIGYRDGFHGQCKTCRNAKIAQWQAAHPEKLAAASARFNKTPKGRAYQKRNRVKHREKRRLNCIRWHSENKEHDREYNIKNKLRKKFNIEPEQYKAMFTAQCGLCMICKHPETSVDKNGVIKNLAVDHNHGNNKLRDLLCMNCNQGIGKFKENIQTLESAIQYLVEWERKHGNQ